jgi:hypothetical protein
VELTLDPGIHVYRPLTFFSFCIRSLSVMRITVVRHLWGPVIPNSARKCIMNVGLCVISKHFANHCLHKIEVVLQHFKIVWLKTISVFISVYKVFLKQDKSLMLLLVLLVTYHFIYWKLNTPNPDLQEICGNNIKCRQNGYCPTSFLIFSIFSPKMRCPRLFLENYDRSITNSAWKG